MPEAPLPKGLLMQWSYSQYSTYEQCPAKIKYQKIDRVPEQGDRAALERGIAVHAVLEDIVKGKKSIDALFTDTPGKPTKLPTWKSEVITLLAEGAVAEGEYSFTQSWTPTQWFAPDAWVRGKLDAQYGNTIIDYKTGKRYPEHVNQANLYAAFEFAKHPELTEINVEFWYVDQPREHPDAKKVWMFKQEDQAQRINMWNHKVSAMMHDTIFPHRPGRHCAWCGFAKSKGGPCDLG
jgi:hypothetical protein